MRPQLVVNAANEFAAAAELYERGGPEADAAETNSFLFWCKKEMTSELAQAFIKTDGITAATAKRLDDAVKEVSKDEARAFLKRAEDFCSAYPHEYMLVAARYFEVADRFKGNYVSVIAQSRSLRAMHLAASSRIANTNPNVVAPPDPSARATKKVTEADIAIASQKLAIDNAAEAAIRNPYRKYMSEYLDASAKIKAQKSYPPTLDPVWKFVETRREAFLAKYRTEARDKPSVESRRALQVATEICENEYKKLH